MKPFNIWNLMMASCSSQISNLITDWKDLRKYHALNLKVTEERYLANTFQIKALEQSLYEARMRQQELDFELELNRKKLKDVDDGINSAEVMISFNKDMNVLGMSPDQASEIIALNKGILKIPGTDM